MNDRTLDSAVWRSALMWKEFRQLVPLALTVLALGLGMLLLILVTTSFMAPPLVDANQYLYVFLSVPMIYACGVGILLVGAEKESRSLRWLQSLPVSSRDIARTKLMVALMSLAAIWLVTLMAWLLFTQLLGMAPSLSGSYSLFGGEAFPTAGHRPVAQSGTTGDNHAPGVPQHPLQLGGKVLRLTPDGRAALGNGAPSGFDSRIFSYGHRNVQGIAFHPGTGEAWVAEHGPNHSDEVMRLVAGGNAGWDPQNRAGLSCPSGYCGYAGNATTMPMTDLGRFPAAIPPAWTNNGGSQGIGPATFLVGSAWRDWNGRLAVGMMAAQRLVVLTTAATGAVSGAVVAPLPAARLRALTLGPGGVLYVVTDAGEIWTVTPGPPG